jgi:two-component system response regulator PilR (NtrC family)
MKNILIVEDEEDILSIFSNQLQIWGYNPIIAKDGNEGIQKFNDFPVDLIITDIRMPKLDGISFLQRVKKIDEHAIVIIATGYPSIDSAITTMKEGAYDYLVKPINIDELKIKIERGLEKRKLLKSISLWKGANWALIISVPLWLILGIILAKLL